MEKMYLVSQGEYSDYNIIALFHDEEKAKKYAQWINGPDDARKGYLARVEIYESSEIDPEPGNTGAYYFARSWLKHYHSSNQINWDHEEEKGQPDTDEIIYGNSQQEVIDKVLANWGVKLDEPTKE